jgi:hypothetical protein
MKGAAMKKNIMIAVAVVVLLAAAIGGYFYWKHSQPVPVPPPPPKVAQPAPPAPPPSPPKPVEQVLEAPPAPPALPKLAESDHFMLDTLADLLGNKTLLKLFNGERLIHNIVATIDNLPRKRAPYSVMPVKQVRGTFMVEGANDDPTISPQNAARYLNYVRIAELIDPKKLVAVYVRLYPLFQEAYEQLGYPKKYFNDRLLFVIDHLLAAPEPKEPIQLVRPNVMYLYADADLESRSAGQKIMMRIGHRNEIKLKAKLRAIKQELLLHMHDKKLQEAGAAPTQPPRPQ